jgi:hypothetical protein
MNGASRDRTGDLLLAKQALSQLSYGPAPPSVGQRWPLGSPEESAPGRPSRPVEDGLLVEIEVARGALLEPEPLLLWCIAEEVGSLLEHVLHWFE